MGDPLCTTGNNATESIQHIFLECDWVSRFKQVWFSSPLTINLDNVQIKTFPEWLDYMFSISNLDSMNIIASIIYGIWTARNQRVFKDKHIPAKKVVSQALTILREYQTNRVTKLSTTKSKPSIVRHINICWSPPPNDVLKFNMDARSKSDGHWGLGLILRRSDESCLERQLGRAKSLPSLGSNGKGTK
jgi:hypothetical protein